MNTETINDILLKIMERGYISISKLNCVGYCEVIFSKTRTIKQLMIACQYMGQSNQSNIRKVAKENDCLLH